MLPLNMVTGTNRRNAQPGASYPGRKDGNHETERGLEAVRQQLEVQCNPDGLLGRRRVAIRGTGREEVSSPLPGHLCLRF